MKTLVIKVKDSLYDRVKSFLDILPNESVEIVEEFNISHIPFVEDSEQKEIEEILRDKEAKEVSKAKTLNFEN